MNTHHHAVPETDHEPPGTAPPPIDDIPVKRPGPDPDTDGEGSEAFSSLR